MSKHRLFSLLGLPLMILCFLSFFIENVFKEFAKMTFSTLKGLMTSPYSKTPCVDLQDLNERVAVVEEVLIQMN